MFLEHLFSSPAHKTAEPEMPAPDAALAGPALEEGNVRRFPTDFDREMLFERLVPSNPFERVDMKRSVMLPHDVQIALKDIFEHEANDSRPGAPLRLEGHDEKVSLADLHAKGAASGSPDGFLYLVSEYARGNDCKPLSFEDGTHNVMYSEAAKSFIEAYQDEEGHVVVHAWHKADGAPVELDRQYKIRLITFEH